jgi:hypothetical protein
VGVFRCTQKLLKAMKVKPVAEPAPSTSRLGDWTANLVRVGRIQLVIAVSEPTRLAVVIDAAPYAEIAERFPHALFKALLDMGIPSDEAAAEAHDMEHPQLAASNSRSVLATLNQFGAHAEWVVGNRVNSAAELTRDLAEYMLLKPVIGYPIDRVHEVFGLQRIDRRVVFSDMALR